MRHSGQLHNLGSAGGPEQVPQPPRLQTQFPCCGSHESGKQCRRKSAWPILPLYGGVKGRSSRLFMTTSTTWCSSCYIASQTLRLHQSLTPTLLSLPTSSRLPRVSSVLKLPIIQFCYSYKLTLLFKPFSPIIQVI